MRTSNSLSNHAPITKIVYLISACLIVLGAYLIGNSSTGLAKNLTALYTPPSSNRVDINLDSTWKFNKSDVAGAQNTTFNDASWTSLSLPHTWNNLDGQDGGNNYYRGVGWYRKHYTVPAGYAGRRLFLQFDGANIVTDVYLNGTSLGQHKGGFAAFRFDVTSLAVIGGDNVIAVKVNNASNVDIPPLSADFTFFGGLYRDVHLLVTDPLALTALDYGSSGVYLKQTNVSAASANLQVTAKVSNANAAAKSVTVNSVIVDAGNNIVQTLTSTQNIAANTTTNVVQTATLTNPHLWNGRTDPYLYHVYVEIKDGATVTDLVSQPLGFRYFSVDANQGFFLNGQYLDLHGVNKHQDRLNKGWAISNADMDEDFSLIMEMGATAVRLAHYQHAQHECDLTDQDGLIVWAEIPLVNNITNSAAFTANAEQQMIELIRQNYNHP
jgi:beta-galactosidase